VFSAETKWLNASDLEIREGERVWGRGGGGGAVLLALPAFLPSVTSPILPKITEALGPSPRSVQNL